MNASIAHQDQGRWRILIILTAVMIVLNILLFQIGGLASRIIPAFHLNPTQFAVCMGAPLLTAAVFGLPAGALADRFGVKGVVTAGLVLSLAGSFGRMGVHSFEGLFGCMLVIGFGLSALNANASKILGAWFPHHQMGQAMGIYISGAGVGGSIALATSALFPTVASALAVSAILMVVVLLFWIAKVQSRPAGAAMPPVRPVLQYLGKVAANPKLWLGALAVLCFMGANVGIGAFLAQKLIAAKGVSPVQAGAIASSYTLATVVSSILCPAFSHRMGLTRPFLAPPAILGAICCYVAWSLPFSGLSWLLFSACGFLVGASVPIVMALPMLLQDIGPVYAGSAGGMLSTFQMAGGFFGPSLIVGLSAGSDSKMFVLMSVMFAFYGIIMLLLPELGARKAPAEPSLRKATARH